jgi:hypothetical protein
MTKTASCGTPLHKLKLKQGEKLLIGHVELSLVGLVKAKFTLVCKKLDAAIPKRFGSSACEIITAYMGLLLCSSKFDFDDNEIHWHCGFFRNALVISGGRVASSLRMQLNAQAKHIILLTRRLCGNLLKLSKVPITQITYGKMSIVIDVFTLDSGHIQKERISRIRCLLMYVTATATVNTYIFRLIQTDTFD